MKSDIRLLALSLIGLLASVRIAARDLPVRQFPRPEKDLYGAFRDPAGRYRPFVRWWWNGSRVEAGEIVRELDVLHAAGIGGVEINTIGFPDRTDTLGRAALPWLSDEWIRMVRTAVDACRERGMTCDIIVGSGWPFGGEFLTRDQQIRQLYPVTVEVPGGRPFAIRRDELLAMAVPQVMHPDPDPGKRLRFLRLMPRRIDAFTEGTVYDALVDDETIAIDVPAGEYVLYAFVELTGYMDVLEGAPGARGPVVNHLDRKAVAGYLERFSERMRFRDGALKGGIRAAFCDSFELEGDNWDPHMLAEFERRCGYSLSPYLPYVIRRVGVMGEPVREPYGSEFSDAVRREVIHRVRNDFERVQTELFQENFIDVYNAWCHRNGLLSRIQAYGRQLHPVESAMQIDIPESESWIHDHIGRRLDFNSYLCGRGYSMVNKAVTSGALLSGRNCISCEEQTNVGNIFQTTLEEVKLTGDRSNLSGVSHSVLHGFNYSPQDADFLGWIKFGTYFSENNTWWPFVRLWTDYKARISAVLQNSVLQADIAVLPPYEDLWSREGQQRDPYPGVTYPDYANDLWEAVHQSGNGCDYVTERVIRQARMRNGRMQFGARSYGTLLLMEVESLDPATARQLARFVVAGGRVICLGRRPRMSTGLKDAAARDAEVRRIVDGLLRDYPDRFVCEPAPEGPMLAWFLDLQRRYGLTPYVRIADPDAFLMVNCYRSAGREIYFLVNSSIDRRQRTSVTFPAHTAGRQAWLWDAETGERYRLEPKAGTLDLDLGPAEAKLIVFDDERGGEPLPALPEKGEPVRVLDGRWHVKAAHHVDKTVREFDIDRLTDFHELPFPWLNSFAGTLEYTQTVRVDDSSAVRLLDAGRTYHGVTELLIDGRPAGVKWYGDRTFDVRGLFRAGENRVTIRVTTLLGDYVKSRTADLPAAQRWDWALRTNRELGLAGPVVLY